MASLIPALCLLSICLAGKNVVVVVVLTILAVMFYGSMFSGVFSNQSDLAPNFAGTLMAVTNMLATIPGDNLSVNQFMVSFSNQVSLSHTLLVFSLMEQKDLHHGTLFSTSPLEF